jgi:hypothetical protein
MNVEMVTYPAAWPPGRAYPAPVAPSVLNLTMVMGVKRVFLMVAEVERTVLRSIIAVGIGVVYKLVFGWVLSSSYDGDFVESDFSCEWKRRDGRGEASG